MENLGTVNTQYLLIGLGVLILIAIIIAVFFMFRSRKSREIQMVMDMIENEGEEKNLIRENERLKNLIEQYVAQEATITNELGKLKEEK